MPGVNGTHPCMPQNLLQAAGLSYLSSSASLSGVSSQANMVFANAPPPPMAAIQRSIPAAIFEPLTRHCSCLKSSFYAGCCIMARRPQLFLCLPPLQPQLRLLYFLQVQQSAGQVQQQATLRLQHVESVTPAAKNPRRSNAPGQSFICPLQDGGGGGIAPVSVGLAASALSAATKGAWSNSSGQMPLGALQPQKGAGGLEPSIL